MPFTISAVLLATVCATKASCEVIEIARFGNGEAGQNFCFGTADAINSTPESTDQRYFCVTPKVASKIMGYKI